MNQGQHIMAGVRAATRRYYRSPRKGKARQRQRPQSFARARLRIGDVTVPLFSLHFGDAPEPPLGNLRLGGNVQLSGNFTFKEAQP